MDNKDLANIIENHPRIILPDFGAFLLKDSNSSTFKPELITFSPFLKYNDGVLEEYYCKYKGISKDESMKQTKAFIESLREALKTDGHYTIEGIGTLSRDSRGAIIFNAEGKSSPITENINIPVSQTDGKPKKSTKSKKTSTAASLNEVPPVEVKIEKAEEQIIEIDPINNSDTEIIGDFTDDTPSTFDNISIIEIDETADSKTNPETITINPTIPDTAPMAKNKNKSKLTLLLIYFGISLTIILVFAFIIREVAFNTEDAPVKIETPEKLNKIETQSNVKESNTNEPKDEIDKAFDEMSTSENNERSDVENEASDVEVQIEKSVIENASIQNQVKERFFLVVGSFKDKTNADRYSNQLKSEGYNSSLIKQPNGNYSVAVGSFPSKEQAISEKNKLSKKFPNIWISKK